jgi:hypothetical protein
MQVEAIMQADANQCNFFGGEKKIPRDLMSSHVKLVQAIDASTPQHWAGTGMVTAEATAWTAIGLALAKDEIS